MHQKWCKGNTAPLRGAPLHHFFHGRNDHTKEKEAPELLGTSTRYVISIYLLCDNSSRRDINTIQDTRYTIALPMGKELHYG